MGTVGMWRLLTVVALAAGTATSVVAQEPEADDAGGGYRAGAGGESEEPAPVRPEQDSKGRSTEPRTSWSTGCRAGTRSSRAPTRAAASRSAPATRTTSSAVQHARRARQLHVLAATSASKPSSSRRGCSTAAARCRSSAAGARRPRSASTASGRTRRRTIARTIASSSRTGRPLLDVLARRGGC